MSPYFDSIFNATNHMHGALAIQKSWLARDVSVANFDGIHSFSSIYKSRIPLQSFKFNVYNTVII